MPFRSRLPSRLSRKSPARQVPPLRVFLFFLRLLCILCLMGTCDPGVHSKRNSTISAFEPTRRGGPQVPAPLVVYTCMAPKRLRP